MNIPVKKVEDWNTLAHTVANKLESGTILMLSGPLGAGKTTFIQALAKELGSTATPKSPTFSLLRTYKLTKNGSSPSRLVHVDAYRIERPEDVLPLNLDEELAVPGTILAIEWPENLALWLSRQQTKKLAITIKLKKDGSREATVTTA